MKILNAKYEKEDLPKLMEENCQHLTSAERQKLLLLLTKFEDLFDSTLGDWNRKTSPVHLESKPGVRPFHTRAYPIP